MSPTFDAGEPGFRRDYKRLTSAQRDRLRSAIRDLVEDLKAGRTPRPALRVKRVRGTKDVWEMSWAPDGRATFQYGQERNPGDAHVIWRRVGTHDIFGRP